MNKPVEIVQKTPATIEPPVSDAAALMATITRAATDASVDAEKMERLWALYERMDSRRAEQAFNVAMTTTQNEMPRILKNSQNEFLKPTPNNPNMGRYANLDAVVRVVTPIYTSHGFALSFGTADCPTAGRYRLVCHVSHNEGFSRDYQADLPIDTQGAKNPTQSFGSSMSYGRRYLTLLIFNASTTDDYDDGIATVGESSNITIEQRDALAKIIEDNKFDLGVFCKWAQVETLADIPAASFGKAMNALNAKVQTKKGAAK